jgi:hypothetical protein
MPLHRSSKEGCGPLQITSSSDRSSPKHCFRIRFHIDDSGQVRQIKAPEIQKRTVLAEKMAAVIRSINGAFCISQEQNQPGPDVRLEALSPVSV